MCVADIYAVLRIRKLLLIRKNPLTHFKKKKKKTLEGGCWKLKVLLLVATVYSRAY